MRTALLAYKERGRRDLRRPLGRAARRGVGASGRRAGARARPGAVDGRARGGPAAAITCCGWPASPLASPASAGVCTPLRLARAVRDSAGLDIAARAANLDQRDGGAPPRRVLERAVIVDDITTTGATPVEAARALRAAGWGSTALRWSPRPRGADRCLATSTRRHI